MADGELKAYRELIYQNIELQPEKNIIARLYGAKINRHKSQCLYSQNLSNHVQPRLNNNELKSHDPCLGKYLKPSEIEYIYIYIYIISK